MISFQPKNQPPVSSVWKFTRRTLPIFGIFAAFPLFAQLPPVCGTNELHHLGRAMAAMNMTTEDFNFDKDHGEPKQCLPWIREALNHPLMMPAKGDDLLKATAEDDGAIWKVGRDLLDIHGPIIYSQAHALHPWKDLDPKLADGLQNFTVASQQAAYFVKQAFAALTDEEKSWLAATAFSDLLRVQRGDLTTELRASGISDSVIARVSSEENAFDPEPATTNFLAVAARLDRVSLVHAGEIFQFAVKSLAATAATITNWPAVRVTFETELGPIIILPPGDHVVTNRALLVLSRDGNTTYRSSSSNSLPPGAANGLLGQPLSAIIDLGGDDHYVGGDSIGPGGALFGVSVIYDMAGDDEYKAHYLGDGGAIFGVSWVEDAKGNDHHDAWGIAQGAAVCGFAVLRDREGNDDYSVGQLGQGFAGFQGCGLLIEDAGADRYYAGGRDTDWGRGGERFLSLAQGFSIGIRGFAGGGIGALIDRGGNDNYTADVYGQGASYWYSAGFLLDVAGNDNYTVHQYGQGTGIHLSLGLLADFAGDDRYTGYILSQGTGHDYGVGFLFDHAGDDTYVADHHSQGRALNNALGVLVDSAGDDAYFARQNNRAQGIGNNGDNREYGSVAVLADLAGNDQYSSGAKNDDRTERPLFGVIYDFSTNAPFAKEAAK